MQKIVTRSEAMAAGEPKYFTGLPCKRGHISPRSTRHRVCLECRRLTDYERSKKRREDPAFREQERLRNAQYAAMKRATDPEWVVVRNAANNAFSKKKYLEDPAYREQQRALRQKAANNELTQGGSLVLDERISDEGRVRKFLSRAAKFGCEGLHSAADIAAIREGQGGRCAICDIDCGADYHVDHIIPLSRGGSNWPENLQILCPGCNLSKGTKTHDEYLDWLSMRVAANDNAPPALARPKIVELA